MIVAQVESLRFTPGRATTPALDGIDLDIAGGEIVLVTGPSGSGKSTLLRALGGLVPHFHGGHFAGRVTVMGLDTRTATPAQLAHWVGTMFQDPETQSVGATVERDITFGLEHHAIPAHDIPQRINDALAGLDAAHLRQREVATLSGGERQRAALAAVLANQPKLLLLDEPTSQLDDDGVRALEHALRSAAHHGVAVVIAEHHHARLSLRPDRTIHLHAGRVVPVAVEDSAPQTMAPTAQMGPGLVVTAIRAGYDDALVLSDCSLVVTPGEVVALHGPNGAGKSTLARVIAGLHEPISGQVQVGGTDITATPAYARYPRIGFVPQDAGRWLLRERVDDEIGLGLEHLAPEDRDRRVAVALADYDLTGLADRHPLDLSVGERERVALAAIMVAHPQVIVVDEPSRGMDPARRDQLVHVMRGHAAQGAAVVVISHDPVFADAVADRHVRLVAGCIEPAATASSMVAA